MIQGSFTCSAVGTTSPRKSALCPWPSPISTDWWRAVWPGVGITRTPGANLVLAVDELQELRLGERPEVLGR